MKHFLCALLLAPVFLAGCAPQHYVVFLNNGRHVIAAEKPHLEGFNFVFMDLLGRTNSVPSEYIRAVAPYTDKSTNGPSR